MKTLIGASVLVILLSAVVNAQQLTRSNPLTKPIAKFQANPGTKPQPPGTKSRKNLGAESQTNPADEFQGRPPVKRVVLYKNGIGYFEHSARVRGTRELNIDFTTAQLNDALNSLTIVDLGGGRITGVRFNSVAPLDEQLKALHLPLGEQTSRNDFLNALRGTDVEVRNGNVSIRGKVLSVETRLKPNSKGEQAAEVTELALVTDGGELRSFELGPTTAVRIRDHDLSDEVRHYLDLIGSAKAMHLRRMTISAAGEGEREVFVSYISEVPVWKSTYRILLPDKPGEKPLVQGWAIVDNTIGEDWKDVRLSLVAGAPQSFVQQISQPYYAPRPVVALPESLTLTPQTHEAALMSAAPAPPPPPLGGPDSGIGGGVGSGAFATTTGLEGNVKDSSGAAIPNAKVTVRNEETGASQTTKTDSQGHYRFSNIQPGNSALFVSAPGFQRFELTSIYLGIGRMNEIHPTLEVGSASQTVEVYAKAFTPSTSSSTVSSAIEEENPEAEGKGIGDLFEYDIKQNVTIGKNQSALVPILQARIEAERVTLWNEDAGEALRALWITNTSGETLDAGSFNVVENETFAGQGLFDAIHTGEKRLLSYAPDPAVRVKVEEDASEDPISKVVVSKGVMVTTKEQREKKTYKVSNSDATPRQVIIEHAARPGWKLAESLKPEESSPSFYRFKVNVDPKQSAELVVEEYQPEKAELALTNLTSDEVALLTEQKRITPTMEQAFRRVLDQKELVAHLDAELKERQKEIEAIGTDQARIRENMKALKGSTEERALLERYTRQLDAQEDRLTALRSQVSELTDKHRQANERLEQILGEITLSETF